MPPAARIGDMHTCPMFDGPKPHVGGPITVGHGTTLIGFMPAARVGDAVTCVGPPDTIAKGSAAVLIGYMPAARMGDITAHGGVIVLGHPTTMIGETGSGGGGAAGPAANAMAAAATSAASAPAATSQTRALTEAAEEGVPTVEHCPYAQEGH